jgi:hypothetical protein
MFKKPVIIVLGALSGSLSAIHLYAYFIKSRAMEATKDEVIEHQEVVYKALILENYSSFTYFVLIVAAALVALFVWKLSIQKIWLNVLLGAVIFFVFVLGTLRFYKWYL